MRKGKKRVLFLERNLRNEKLGVMYLAGSLKLHGHTADLIQTDKEDLDSRIRSFRPDFVAFSITTGEHIYALAMAQEVKARYGIPNIFGGPHCTFFPEIGYETAVDYCVQGQGEQAILDIVEGRVSPGFHKAEMAVHLDNIPDPDREIFYQYPEFRDNPMKNLITSRACPYKCSYCFNHSQLALTKIDGETKRWFDRRSIEHVVGEINHIRERYPLEKILFIDDSFIQSKSWLDAFLTGYTEHVSLPWLCSLRVNCLDESLALRMFESRLEMVNYAIESADPDVQQRLLHRGHISNSDVIRAIELFDQYGVRARMQNMIGLPLGNTLEDALNTLQFNMRHRVTDAWCSIFQPYPRTALGQYCLDHGFIEADQLKHCSESFFDESRLSIPHKSELYALQKLWYFVIEGNLKLDLVQLLIKGQLTKETANDLQKLRFKCSRKNLYGIDDADPEVAIDLQSRERWGIHQGESVNTDTAARGSHVRPYLEHALKESNLPDRFVDILSTIEYDTETTRQLEAFAHGRLDLPTPIYTIDDQTGELADPDVSILTRGVSDPASKDIREMPESHFMQGMAEVRDDLKVNAGKGNSASLTVLESASNSTAQTCGTAKGPDEDERHLNQYLA
ncbi:MAG: B12-binding domain-containing radical SAM protein [Phycisphaerae bacterium]